MRGVRCAAPCQAPQPGSTTTPARIDREVPRAAGPWGVAGRPARTHVNFAAVTARHLNVTVRFDFCDEGLILLDGKTFEPPLINVPLASRVAVGV